MAQHEQVVYSIANTKDTLKEILEEIDLDNFFYKEETDFHPEQFSDPVPKLYKLRVTIKVEKA